MRTGRETPRPSFNLAVNGTHLLFGVVFAGDYVPEHRPLDVYEAFVGEHDIYRAMFSFRYSRHLVLEI